MRTHPTRIASLVFATILIFLATGCASRRSPDAVRLDGLPWLKDPAAWVHDEDNARWLLVAMERGGRLRAWDMRETTVEREVEIEFPALEKGYARWGPCLFEEDGTLWTCAGVGRPFDWPTFRLRASECTIANDIERDAAGNVARVRFRDERPIDYFPDNVFAGVSDYALIDPEYARDRDGLWLIATVVLHAQENVRPHESFIRARRALSPRAIDPAIEPVVLHDGRNANRDGDPDRNIDDGVAEAPTWLGRGEILYSSWPSDNDQRIVLLESRKGVAGPWRSGPILLSSNAEVSPKTFAGEPFEARGVGGQTVVVLRGRPWVVYQGLGPKGFHLAMRDLNAVRR